MSSGSGITPTAGPPQHPEPIVIGAYVCFAIGGILILGGIIRLLVWACSSASEDKSRENFYSNRGTIFCITSPPEMIETRRQGGDVLAERAKSSTRNFSYAKPVDTSDETNGGSEISKTESQVHDVSSGRGSAGNESPLYSLPESNGEDVTDSELVDILIHQLKHDNKNRRSGSLNDGRRPASENFVTRQKVPSVEENVTSTYNENIDNEARAWSHSDKLAGDMYMTLRNQRVSASPRLPRDTDQHFVSEVHMIVNDSGIVQSHIQSTELTESDAVFSDSEEDVSLSPQSSRSSSPDHDPEVLYIPRDEIHVFYPRQSTTSEPEEGYFNFTDQLDHDITPEYEDNRRQLTSTVIRIPFNQNETSQITTKTVTTG